jgi:multiple sugar transport system permease protein
VGGSDGILAGGTQTVRGQAGLLGKLVGGHTPAETREALWGYIFISPWLLGLLIFVGGPILVSLFLSFTEYDILSPPKLVGLANYRQALFADTLFWSSLGRTFYYAIVVVPLGLLGALGLATLLNQGLKGSSFVRTLFYLPSLTPTVALAIMWVWLLHPELGLANSALRTIGLGGFPWLTDKDTVIPSYILISLWATVGGNSMLIFLAGLQGVPKELEEAAEIDGASPWSRWRHVTLPMVTPTLFFNLVLGIIGALQVFAVAFVGTNGGPSYGSWFYCLHIYQQSFSYMRLGYGSSLAWIFLVIILALTLVNIRLSRSWVYYRGGS